MAAKPTTKPDVSIVLTAAVAIDGEVRRPSKKPFMVADALAKNLLHRGRAVLAVGSDDDAGDEEKPLEEMSLAELRAEAKELEIKGVSNMAPDALIKAINAALGE